MKKVVFVISKEGEVLVQAVGYQGQECLKSDKVQKVMRLLRENGEIDKMEVEGQRELLQEVENLW